MNQRKNNNLILKHITNKEKKEIIWNQTQKIDKKIIFKIIIINKQKQDQ